MVLVRAATSKKAMRTIVHCGYSCDGRAQRRGATITRALRRARIQLMQAVRPSSVVAAVSKFYEGLHYGCCEDWLMPFSFWGTL